VIEHVFHSWTSRFNERFLEIRRNEGRKEDVDSIRLECLRHPSSPTASSSASPSFARPASCEHPPTAMAALQESAPIPTPTSTASEAGLKPKLEPAAEGPSTAPIEAYFKLDFDDFSYYLQTLSVTIGRRVQVSPSLALARRKGRRASKRNLSRREHRLAPTEYLANMFGFLTL
jgi:hypothetical protein